MSTSEQDAAEHVTAKGLLDCLEVAGKWLKVMPRDKVTDDRWPGLVEAVLTLRQQLAALVKEDCELARPQELSGRGVGTTSGTGCGGK